MRFVAIATVYINKLQLKETILDDYVQSQDDNVFILPCPVIQNKTLEWLLILVKMLRTTRMSFLCRQFRSILFLFVWNVELTSISSCLPPQAGKQFSISCIWCVNVPRGQFKTIQRECVFNIVEVDSRKPACAMFNKLQINRIQFWSHRSIHCSVLLCLE